MHPTDERTLLLSLTVAIAGGLGLIILARRAHLPAIVLLLLGGVGFGPEGIGLIQPASLEGLLPVIVSLAIGLILFEGGLTLDLRGFSRGSNAITGLLTVGVLVTWLGTAVAAGFASASTGRWRCWRGSMVIVTGPTVIGPLLKRLQIEPKLHNILHWEAVLIDAIGVFVATLCFEWIAGHSGRVAVGNFGLRALSGAAVGGGGRLRHRPELPPAAGCPRTCSTPSPWRRPCSSSEPPRRSSRTRACSRSRSRASSSVGAGPWNWNPSGTSRRRSPTCSSGCSSCCWPHASSWRSSTSSAGAA